MWLDASQDAALANGGRHLLVIHDPSGYYIMALQDIISKH